VQGPRDGFGGSRRGGGDAQPLRAGQAERRAGQEGAPCGRVASRRCCPVTSPSVWRLVPVLGFQGCASLSGTRRGWRHTSPVRGCATGLAGGAAAAVADAHAAWGGRGVPGGRLGSAESRAAGLEPAWGLLATDMRLAMASIAVGPVTLAPSRFGRQCDNPAQGHDTWSSSMQDIEEDPSRLLSTGLFKSCRPVVFPPKRAGEFYPTFLQVAPG
jgi:hypothetical protein